MKKYTPAEIALLGTAPDAMIARRLGRSVRSVETARIDRGIPGHKKSASAAKWRKHDRLLGKSPDTAIARKMGITPEAVVKRRRKLNVPAQTKRNSRAKG